MEWKRSYKVLFPHSSSESQSSYWYKITLVFVMGVYLFPHKDIIDIEIETEF